MKRKSVFIMAMILILTMAFSTAGVYAKTLSDVNDQIKEQKDKLSEGKKQEKALSQEIQDLEKKIGQVENEVYDLEGDIGETEAKISAAEEELKEAEKRVSEQNENLNSRLRSMYKNGSVGFIDVLLSSGSISEFITNIEMVKIIHSSDQEVLEQLQTAYEEIDAKKKNLENLQDEMVAQKQELLDKQSSLEADQAEVAKKKEGVVRANGEVEDNIAALEAEAASIKNAINNDTSDNSNSSYNDGVFNWPVPGHSKINSPYGWRNCPFHGKEFHSGVDIDANYGDRIVAAASGTVILAQYNGSYGNCVIISHGGGLYTLYAHNSSLLVRNGSTVSKGQQIARAGSTGNSTGVHLHFEVRKGGNSYGNHTNPMNYF